MLPGASDSLQLHTWGSKTRCQAHTFIGTQPPPAASAWNEQSPLNSSAWLGVLSYLFSSCTAARPKTFVIAFAIAGVRDAPPTRSTVSMSSARRQAFLRASLSVLSTPASSPAASLSNSSRLIDELQRALNVGAAVGTGYSTTHLIINQSMCTLRCSSCARKVSVVVTSSAAPDGN